VNQTQVHPAASLNETTWLLGFNIPKSKARMANIPIRKTVKKITSFESIIELFAMLRQYHSYTKKKLPFCYMFFSKFINQDFTCCNFNLIIPALSNSLIKK